MVARTRGRTLRLGGRAARTAARGGHRCRGGALAGGSPVHRRAPAHRAAARLAGRDPRVAARRAHVRTRPGKHRARRGPTAAAAGGRNVHPDGHARSGAGGAPGEPALRTARRPAAAGSRMTEHAMSAFDLGFAAALVVLSAGLSLVLQLGVARSLLIAGVRTVVQLLLVGLVLKT